MYTKIVLILFLLFAYGCSESAPTSTSSIQTEIVIPSQLDILTPSSD